MHVHWKPAQSAQERKDKWLWLRCNMSQVLASSASQFIVKQEYLSKQKSKEGLQLEIALH